MRTCWATLAIDQNRNSFNGTLTAPNGVTVSFYKNWLYVSNKPGDRNILRIEEGALDYLDVRIVAARGPNSGCYAVVWSPGEQAMAGCCASLLLGEDRKTREFLKRFINLTCKQESMPNLWADLDLNNMISYLQEEK